MSEWVTIEAERVLYVERGRTVIACDRGFSGPVTLIVKLRNLEESAPLASPAATPSERSPICLNLRQRF